MIQRIWTKFKTLLFCKIIWIKTSFLIHKNQFYQFCCMCLINWLEINTIITQNTTWSLFSVYWKKLLTKTIKILKFATMLAGLWKCLEVGLPSSWMIAQNDELVKFTKVNGFWDRLTKFNFKKFRIRPFESIFEFCERN